MEQYEVDLYVTIQVDEDGNGSIDFDEFLSMMSEKVMFHNVFFVKDSLTDDEGSVFLM